MCSVKFYLFFFISFFCLLSFAGPKVNISIYPEIKVDKTNINLFSTPLAYYRGNIYTVNVEPAIIPMNTGLNLRTIVRKAIPIGVRTWEWQSTIIDDATIEDKYHTQASIAVDKHGYLHVAYGMHNMPWQYVISDQPGDISSFSFYGDSISIVDKIAVKVFNKTPFPEQGLAIIPGNQVTYPAFFYDNHADLYITYRFAVKPRRKFKDRAFSGAIARYDIVTKKWNSLGGSIVISKEDADLSGNNDTNIVKAFAYQEGWTVYPPRLAFDKQNGMHVAWTWRQNRAGGDTTHPSYAFSPSDKNVFYNSMNDAYSLPISLSNAEWIGVSTRDKFSSIPEISVDDNSVYVILQKWQDKRAIYTLNRYSGKWSDPEPSPFGASVIKFDSAGGQWAFATGLTVLYRKNTADKWQVVFQETGKVKYGYPKVLEVPEKNEFYIHTQSLNSDIVRIYKLEY